MRIVLFSLLAALAAGPAAAECTCVCSRGAPRGICSQISETPPICQQICPLSLAPESVQSPLSTPSVGGGQGGGGGGSLEALAGGAAGLGTLGGSALGARGGAALGRGF